MGFIARRYWQTDSKSIGNILIFILAPVVYFVTISRMPVHWADMALPILFFCLASLLCLLFWWIGPLFFADNRRYLLAATAGMANSGFFGIGVFLAINQPENLGVYLFAVFGYMFYEAGIGYFVMARGQYTMRQSLLRLAKMPILYAGILGLCLALTHITLPQPVQDMGDASRQAFIVLGMMVVGMNLSDVKLHHWDWPYILLATLAKFVVLPALAVGIILADRAMGGNLSTVGQQALLAWVLVPLAANTAVFAGQLGLHPEKAASAVFFTTMLALMTIPLTLWLVHGIIH
jgi:predicted permease